VATEAAALRPIYYQTFQEWQGSVLSSLADPASRRRLPNDSPNRDRGLDDIAVFNRPMCYRYPKNAMVAIIILVSFLVTHLGRLVVCCLGDAILSEQGSICPEPV
jgi:hypothetical protein